MTEFLDAPKCDAEPAEWRRYTGELRKRLGDAKQKARTLQGELDRVNNHRAFIAREKIRDARLLNKIEDLLFEGDVPEVVNLLSKRRLAIELAKAERAEREARE